MQKSLALTLILCTMLLVACDGGAGAEKATEKLELAVKYLSENNFEQAILAYQEVITIDPKNTQAYQGLSMVYALQDNLEQAKQVLQDGLEQVTGAGSLKLAMAGLLADVGEKEQAITIYQQLTGSDEIYLPAYRAYTKLLLKQGQYQEAITLLEKAAAADTAPYQIYNLLAETHLGNGDEAQTLVAIEQSLAAEPNQSAAYDLLNQIFRDRPEELLAWGEQQQELTGQLVKLTALYRQEQYQELTGQYQQLPETIKANHKAKILAVQAYLQLDQKDHALELLTQIDTKELNNAALLAGIAGCYL